jgi:hypothetical protein
MEYGNNFKPKPVKLSHVDLEVRDLSKLQDYLMKNKIGYGKTDMKNPINPGFSYTGSTPMHGGDVYNFRAPYKVLRDLIKMMQSSPENSVNQENEFLTYGIAPYKEGK